MKLNKLLEQFDRQKSTQDVNQFKQIAKADWGDQTILEVEKVAFESVANHIYRLEEELKKERAKPRYLEYDSSYYPTKSWFNIDPKESLSIRTWRSENGKLTIDPPVRTVKLVDKAQLQVGDRVRLKVKYAGGNTHFVITYIEGTRAYFTALSVDPSQKFFGPSSYGQYSSISILERVPLKEFRPADVQLGDVLQAKGASRWTVTKLLYDDTVDDAWKLVSDKLGTGMIRYRDLNVVYFVVDTLQ